VDPLAWASLRDDELLAIGIREANPNPSLARDDDFAQAAMQVGIDYEARSKLQGKI